MPFTPSEIDEKAIATIRTLRQALEVRMLTVAQVALQWTWSVRYVLGMRAPQAR